MLQIDCLLHLQLYLSSFSHQDAGINFYEESLENIERFLKTYPANKNIIYAFGHQHLGWTLGAITGKIISGIVAGEKTNLDLSPYSSARFN